MPSNFDATLEGSLLGELENYEGLNGQNQETGAWISSGKSFMSEYSNRLFGAPFQLLDSVDRRFPTINSNLGNEYLRNFILNSPILHIRPGMPEYTGDRDKNSFTRLLKNIYGDVVSTATNLSLGSATLHSLTGAIIFGSGNKLQNRMFGFRETYYDYIQHVNYMCRSMANFMSLTGNAVDSTTRNIRKEMPNGCYVSGGKGNSAKWMTFDKIDWQDYRMMSETNAQNPNQQLSEYLGVTIDNFKGALEGLEGISKLLFTDDSWTDESYKEDLKNAVNDSAATSLLGKISSKISSVEFMVEPSQFTETLTNETGTSFIEQKIDSLNQGVGSEIAWITNSSTDVGIIDNLVSFLGDGLSSVSESIAGLVEPAVGGWTGNLFRGAIGSLKGQKMIYPKIYKSSNSAMNYHFTVTLTTPYGDAYNYYMNIIVPLMHLIALAAPRMVSSNTIASPFLVQAYMPGMCTCQLGIIQNMVITKNPTNKRVSVNGYPLTVKVEFDIEELYNAMSISPANDPASFMYNETLNDYMCNLAGLIPSQDTYAVQRQSQYQAIDRWFDKGLMAQDLFNMGLTNIENFWVR